MRSFDEIQAAYVNEMRALQPELIEWWRTLAGVSDPNDPAPPDVTLRWPTGFSGHPRAIEVFRRYFLEIEERNDRVFRAVGESRGDVPDIAWGVDQGTPRPQMRRAAELLIDEIDFVAPEIAKFVAGFVFIPVGLNQYDEPV